MPTPGGHHHPMLDKGGFGDRADDGARAVPAVLQALDSRGIPVAAMTVARPSLDDVYLHHTGRDFRSEDEASA